MYVINDFLKYARGFVRLGFDILPRTNALAYYKFLSTADVKGFYKILPSVVMLILVHAVSNVFLIVMLSVVVLNVIVLNVIMLSVIVANAKFSSLKLLIYEPNYLCLSRLECQA